ncbi:MAG: cobyrinate a,c-diamide synthase [Azospirillum sp.]|nr:cobyrinate a,c-diamide synthase [Azospirillum sp.]
MSGRGLVIAAPASGSGKTTVTLALLRHFRNAGIAVGSAKVGPDYIDPKFHAAASGRTCLTLDPWAMRPQTLARLLAETSCGVDLTIVEGVMGVFDGAADGSGSTADLAVFAGWPVVLVVDVKAQAQSAAALVHGFATWRPDLRIAGVIFNRVGSPTHLESIRRAIAPLGIPVLGALPRLSELALPDRHLGLVQAAEHGDLEAFLTTAAARIAEHVECPALRALASASATAVCSKAERSGEGRPGAGGPWPQGLVTVPELPPPLGQRIALADDVAFAFAYPHLLSAWRVQGAELIRFSPLADQSPDPAADAVYLPGGYPELHAGRLAGNRVFLDGLRAASDRGAVVYGECGGFMVLGRGLVDGGGVRHAMAGLLPVATSFAERRLRLGYRRARCRRDSVLGPVGRVWTGHEFHYASVIEHGAGEGAPFEVWDSSGRPLGPCGATVGRVIGSFLHLIDRA